MTQARPKVLVLGDIRRDEFQPIIGFLRAHQGGSTARQALDVAGLRQFVERDNWFPDLVVVLQAWPDEFSEADFHDLLALCPLARIVCCFGPWCDSDGRTRSIWPLAVRVPATAALGRLTREWELLENQPSALRPLPLTASRAEIFEFDFCGLKPGIPTAQTATVISPDRRFQQMLESALRKGGLQICDASDADPATAVLFDTDLWNEERAVALSSIRASYATAKIVACAGFPLPEFDATLRRSGADEVWFKLAPLQELLAFIQ